MIRSILAGVLRGVVSQRLLPRVDGGRVAAVEVMVTNARIADLIRENRAGGDLRGDRRGRVLPDADLQQALIDLVLAGAVDHEIAANAATNRHDFLVALEQALKQQAPTRRSAEPPPKPAAGRCASRASRSPRRSPGFASPIGRADVMKRVSPSRPRARSARRGERPAPGRVFTSSRSAPSRRCRAPRCPNAEGSLLLPPGWTVPDGSPAARSYAELQRLWQPRGRGLRDSRGRCSPRSTRSSRTSAGTWARARPARSAGCSSCPRPGCAGGWTRTATASPTRGTPRTRSSRPPATSPPPAARPISTARDLRLQPRPLVRATTCSSWRALYGTAAARSASRSTGSSCSSTQAGSGRRRGEWRLVEARRVGARRSTASERLALGRADAAELLSPTARARAATPRRPASAARGGRERRVARRRSSLDDAEAALERPAQAQRRPSFAPPAGALARGPRRSRATTSSRSAAARRVVSVAHDHHDYPAADIAAPQGAPLFALADGFVDDAWPHGQGNCGIGFTLRHRGRPRAGRTATSPTSTRRRAGRGARRRRTGRPRRLDRPLDRPAPAPPAPAGH